MSQPEFLTPLRNHTVEVGKNVTFECYVTGIEKYKVSEFKLAVISLTYFLIAYQFQNIS